MLNFAVIENKAVINIIVAESKEIAESVVNKECVEFFLNDPITIGASWSDVYNKYVNPSPYPSWVYNGNEWKAPIDMPQDDNPYVWDENLLNWVSA